MRHLLRRRTTTTDPRGMIDMTTTEPTAVEAELAEALAAVETERTADPVGRAADVAEWRAREDKRTARAADIAERLHRRRTFGTLLDDDRVWSTVQNYDATVRDARAALAYVSEHRTFRTGRTVPPTESRSRALDNLGAWLRGLRTLSRLPDTEDAHRYRVSEVEAWLRSRTAVAAAMLDREGDLPVPEGPDGILPGLGVRIAVLPIQAHDGPDRAAR